jgi:hypothetical protein
VDERDYIISRMSPLELSALAEVGMVLPPVLQARVEAWRRQEAQDEMHRMPKRSIWEHEGDGREVQQDAECDPPPAPVPVLRLPVHDVGDAGTAEARSAPKHEESRGKGIKPARRAAG